MNPSGSGVELLEIVRRFRAGARFDDACSGVLLGNSRAENNLALIEAIEALLASPQPSPATDALADELERLERNAVWLFRAFVAGVAGRDVKDGRVSRNASEEWKTHAVETFETSLAEHRKAILSALREREPVATDIGQGNHDCLAKRRPGEPMFILLGRDPDAHNIVRLWGERRLQAGGDKDHCEQAFATAARMQAYASDPANRPASAPDASAYPAPAPTLEHQEEQS